VTGVDDDEADVVVQPTAAARMLFARECSRYWKKLPENQQAAMQQFWAEFSDGV
ncbi:Hypothetical protein UVM_LOCUS155, partial [uncultured virus]